MKRLINVFCLLFCLITLAAADAPFSEPTQDPTVRYRLFPTQNMYTFLKLDTMTGKIWQVQYSTKGDEYRFESELSSIDIADLLKLKKEIGRYTLFPTQNFYNFILLDQIDGYTYQVQWNNDEENRGVLPISY
jgi:hypothetical protein